MKDPLDSALAQRRRRAALCVLGLAPLIVSTRALADDPKAGNNPGTLLQAADVVPGVSEATATSAANLASAAIQAAPSGAKYRIAVMPFYLANGSNSHVLVLSDSRITVITDPSSNLTTAALTLSYNPFALQSGRSDGIWKKIETASDCWSNYSTVGNVKVILINLMLPNSFDDPEWDSLKVGVTSGAYKNDQTGNPIHFPDNYGPQIQTLEDDVVAVIKARETILSLRSGNPSAEMKTLADLVFQTAASRTNEQAAAIAKNVQDDVTANHGPSQKCANKMRATLWKQLRRTSLPQIMATVGLDAYPAGVGMNPLDKTGLTTAPLEPWGGVRTELSLLFSLDERLQFELFGQYRRIRPSGAPYTQMADYEGGGITIAWMPVTFLSGTPAENSDYVKSGALPGVTVGVSGQVLHCDGFANCAAQQPSGAAVVSGESFTPFFDLKFLNAAQFRFSLPMKWTTSVLQNDFNVTPTLSAVSAFAGL